MQRKRTQQQETKALRIAFEANEANVPNRVGSNVYAFEILTALEKVTRKNSRVNWTVLLAQPAISDLPKEREGWRYQLISPKPLQTQIGLPIHLFLNKKNYDVYFTPGHYAPRLCAVPYVSSVMDIGYLKYPEHFRGSDLVQLKNWTAYSVRRAKKIVAISQHTKLDVCTYYRRKPEDVVVATPALSEAAPKLSAAQERSFFRKHTIHKPYLLFVGTFQPRKNLERVVEAFEHFKTTPQGKEVRLVLAGKIGWLSEPLLAKIKKSHFKKDILRTGFVTEAEKNTLLHGASGSLLLGLYEGFGIPPLESLRAGTIPIVSNTASLPEVVGKAGITADPTDVAAITAAFTTLFSLSAREKTQLKRYARKQLRSFSWERSAHTILTTLTEVASQ